MAKPRETIKAFGKTLTEVRGIRELEKAIDLPDPKYLKKYNITIFANKNYSIIVERQYHYDDMPESWIVICELNGTFRLENSEEWEPTLAKAEARMRAVTREKLAAYLHLAKQLKCK